MNDRNKESLSALMDGEADELELRRILNQIDNNDELLDSWKNYHLMGSIMRDEKVEPIDLTHGINQELDGHETIKIRTENSTLHSEILDHHLDHQASNASNVELVKNESESLDYSQNKTVSWYKPFTSVAVAASVTLAVLVGFQMVEPSSNLNSVGIASNSQVTADPVFKTQEIGGQFSSQFASTVSMDVNNSDVQAQQAELENAQKQLQDYVLQHSLNAEGGQQNNQGVLPFARVVEFKGKENK